MFCVGKQRNTLIICSGSAITLQLYGAYFYKILVLIMWDIKTFKQTINEFLLNPPFKKKRALFVDSWGVCDFIGYMRLEE